MTRVDRSELFASLARAGPDAEDIVYVERRGPAYFWYLVRLGPAPRRSSL